MTTDSLAAPRAATRTAATPALLLLAALLVLSLVARLGFTIWEPAFDPATGLGYDALRAAGTAYWPVNLFVGGPAYLVSFVVTAVLLVVLGRGRLLSLLAALLVGLGGTIFALTITAESLPYAYAVDPTLFDETAGRALVDTWNGRLGALWPAILGSQVAIAAGATLGLVAARLAGTAPLWFALCGWAYVAAFALVPFDRLGEVARIVDYGLQLTLLAGIGWFALRSSGALPGSSPR